MSDNTGRFTGRAEDYDRYRQRYPSEEILARLGEWCGLRPEWLVADVGAGTGMLTEVFLVNGNRVLAIEPNADMRELMRTVCAPPQANAAQLEILDATAEATTLSDASVDLIAVGRAFHWFDKEHALAEFRRILAPGGWVTLVAIDRARESDDPAAAEQIEVFEGLLAVRGTDYTRVRSGYRTYDKMDTFFDGELYQAQLHGLRQLDWPAMLGHARSLSVTPQPGQAGYEAFERELHSYFERFARDGVLTIPTICWITAARFAPR